MQRLGLQSHDRVTAGAYRDLGQNRKPPGTLEYTCIPPRKSLETPASKSAGQSSDRLAAGLRHDCSFRPACTETLPPQVRTLARLGSLRRPNTWCGIPSPLPRRYPSGHTHRTRRSAASTRAGYAKYCPYGTASLRGSPRFDGSAERRHPGRGRSHIPCFPRTLLRVAEALAGRIVLGRGPSSDYSVHSFRLGRSLRPRDS